MKTEKEIRNKNLQRVDQNEIGRIYSRMLENPELFMHRPIVVWRSYFKDGILFTKLQEINSDHNKNRNREEREYLRLKPLKLDSLNEIDPENTLTSSFHKGVVLYVEIPERGYHNPAALDSNFGSKISEMLRKIKEFYSVPIILHLPFIESPEILEGTESEQYIYHPDYEEWKRTETRYTNPLINLLIGFLDCFKNEDGIEYSWYWYYHKTAELTNESYSDASGCDFPTCWMEGIHKLWRFLHPPMAQIPKDYKPRKDILISQMPINKFQSFFNEGISKDLIEAFRNYTIEQHDRREDPLI